MRQPARPIILRELASPCMLAAGAIAHHIMNDREVHVGSNANDPMIGKSPGVAGSPIFDCDSDKGRQESSRQERK